MRILVEIGRAALIADTRLVDLHIGRADGLMARATAAQNRVSVSMDLQVAFELFLRIGFPADHAVHQGSTLAELCLLLCHC